MEVVSKAAIDKAFEQLNGNYKESSDSTKKSPEYISETGDVLSFPNKGYIGVAKWLRETYRDDRSIQKILDEGARFITTQEKNDQVAVKLTLGVTETLSDGSNYREWLKCCSKFPKYSFNNSMLIYLQKPEATLVCGYKTWQNEFERNVKHGEKGITIYAPVVQRRKTNRKITDEQGNYLKDEAGAAKVEEVVEEYTTYRAVSVFDVSQTEGEELPSICKELKDDVEDYRNVLRSIERTSPVRIKYVNPEELNGAKGCYSYTNKIIKIARGMSEAQTIKTLSHEVAHAMLGHGSPECKTPKAEREMEAESVAFIVCSHLGIDTSEYSFEYLASWSQDKKSAFGMDFMAKIQSMAAKIENIIDLNRVYEKNTEYYEDKWENRNDEPLIAVFQLPEDNVYSTLGYDDMVNTGYIPSINDFELKYVEIDNNDKGLEQIYAELNADNRPNAEDMHPLSIGDVIIKYDGYESTAYMVDGIGFMELEGFDRTNARVAHL